MTFPETPIVFLAEDQHRNRLWVKRDDLLPFSFGGNKARIAAELMEDMQKKGGDHMIAYGNARSNLCRVLSNLCYGAKTPCTILSPADDDGSREDSYNLLMSRRFQAEIVPCLKTDVAGTVQKALADSAAKGRRPYYIYGDPTGAGNLETPVRAYRKVWPELLRQQQRLGLRFDELFLASGTGMTQAGLLAGQALDGGACRINGISIARDAQAGAAHVQQYLRAFLGSEAGDVVFIDDYALGYGVYTPAVSQCAAETLARYGLPLDMTYTGKAFYGMLKEIEKRRLAGRNLLFLHTGGTPLFFDKARELLSR